MHVVIVGCGLGGLACAIGCRHAGLEVTVLEQSAELAEVRHTPIIRIHELY
jgi:salicylate hydroxylase